MNTLYSPTLERQTPQRPVFGLAKSLAGLLAPNVQGFFPTRGVHIYCELRPSEKLKISESDQSALKYLRTIEDYVHYGIAAANQSQVLLFEPQGNVLHFYRPGELTRDTVLDALRFSYVFTSTLYDELKDDLGEDWNGFATAMDHGDCVVVRHGFDPSSSTVSLGPSANRPAKQLLYGRTPAGHIDVPSTWAAFFGVREKSEWYSINAKDRSPMGLANSFEDAQMRQQFLNEIRRFRQDGQRSRISGVTLLDAGAMYRPNFKLTAPHRLEANCIRADLDGFARTIEAAFRQGEEAVEAVALRFKDILEFGDSMQRVNPGSILLPWAGDCATLIVPPRAGVSANLREHQWLETAIQWQTLSDADEKQRQKWQRLFTGVDWSIGAAHGDRGLCVVAPIQTLNRSFLIGAGWPVATSLTAQNKGKGREILIHQSDYDSLPRYAQKEFSKIIASEFWKASELTGEKLRQNAIRAAQSQTPSPTDFGAKVASLQIPRPQPHCIKKW
jgi:hypothetical protein